MRYTGTIVRFMPERSFGFINYREGDIFFHKFDTSGFNGNFERGQRVTFEVILYKGRPKAFDVKPLSNEGASNEN
jgi:cold shock CspA family protein